MNKERIYLKSLNNDCLHCGLDRTIDGHDGCVGILKGVKNACCGHGLESEAYVQFNHDNYKKEPNKIRIAGKEALNYIKVINLIKEIRNSNPVMLDIFLAGSCCNFYFILKTVFPNAKAYFNIDHVVTEIEGRFFDITGEVSKEEFKEKGYMSIDSIYADKYKTDESVKAGEMYDPMQKARYLRDKSKYINSFKHSNI